MSKPFTGAVAGIMFGFLVGSWGIFYLDLTDWLSRVCLIASSMLVFQLLGTTIGAALGKPTDQEFR